jgi:hypothetical protein
MLKAKTSNYSLVPAVHAFLVATSLKTWMPGTRPGMTR